MKRYSLFFISFFYIITLSGRDTTLFKIITSPTPIRHMVKIDGKIILARYDGIFEFDGENFNESNYEYNDLSASLEKNEQWAKLADPKMDFAQVQLSSDGIYWVLIRNNFLYVPCTFAWLSHKARQPLLCCFSYCVCIPRPHDHYLH